MCSVGMKYVTPGHTFSVTGTGLFFPVLPVCYLYHNPKQENKPALVTFQLGKNAIKHYSARTPHTHTQTII
uniref:Uncharacterized protein n=1 Tax=Anguilla anguilla TaxID=7936 RepID=A0A0E9WJ96_ANGAN